jgi:small subunit ribosomal protein S17
MIKKQASHQTKIRGIVKSDKMDKTVVIEVVTLKRHLLYQKVYKVSKRFKIHDKKNEAKIGDEITAESCKPISKDKHFVLVKILKTKHD